MFELSDLWIWIVLSAIGMYWWSSQGIKQRALAVCKAHCKKMDLQLLDDSVVLHRLWLKRDKHGGVRVRRKYQFEFASTGDERYRGQLTLLGHDIESIIVEPHRLN